MAFYLLQNNLDCIIYLWKVKELFGLGCWKSYLHVRMFNPKEDRNQDGSQLFYFLIFMLLHYSLFLVCQGSYLWAINCVRNDDMWLPRLSCERYFYYTILTQGEVASLLKGSPNILIKSLLGKELQLSNHNE